MHILATVGVILELQRWEIKKKIVSWWVKAPSACSYQWLHLMFLLFPSGAAAIWMEHVPAMSMDLYGPHLLPMLPSRAPHSPLPPPTHTCFPCGFFDCGAGPYPMLSSLYTAMHADGAIQVINKNNASFVHCPNTKSIQPQTLLYPLLADVYSTSHYSRVAITFSMVFFWANKLCV